MTVCLVCLLSEDALKTLYLYGSIKGFAQPGGQH
jgi:hypothetical protein